jgi:signal peptidase I
MREDVTPAAALASLGEAEAALKAAAEGADVSAIEKAYDRLGGAIAEVAPRRSHAALRENLEIVIVAVAVAMGFRTYFVQPFKIPTGSMQPTLYGIHYRQQEAPGLLDRYPIKPLKWAVVGEWYREFRAESFGPVRPLGESGGKRAYAIGGITHLIPRDLPLRVAAGEEVVKGQILASGVRITGDHIFVNKVKWNFVRPRRGDVMVFSTDNIPDLAHMRTHYIKRMVGLPRDRIGIAPPWLTVGGQRVEAPETIARIERRAPGYDGYQFATPYGASPGTMPFIGAQDDERDLGEAEYLGFGDNTTNSFDSRYWGPVPQANLVGPAFMVYWPLSARWGWIR